jgi:hypothetical protein
MPKDWNALNNALSEKILDQDLLEDLLGELGCENVKENRNGRAYRCRIRSRSESQPPDAVIE